MDWLAEQSSVVTDAVSSIDAGDALSSGIVMSLVKSFAVIVVSEIGDKTFFIAAVMAIKHSRVAIFTAAMSALLVMTILSAFLGTILPLILTKRTTQTISGILFLIFGARMLGEAYKMTGGEGEEEMNEVIHELNEKKTLKEGDEMESAGKSESMSKSSWSKGCHNLSQYILSPVWVEVFLLTFLAEWGDRSQIATVALAGSDNFWWVVIGGLLGHALCTFIAVIGGKLIAKKISVKTVTFVGALLFLIFGITTLIQSFGIAVTIRYHQY